MRSLAKIFISPGLWVAASFLQTLLGKISLALVGSAAAFCLWYFLLIGFVSYIGWLLLGCFLFLVVCFGCGCPLLTLWYNSVAHRIISIQYDNDVQITLQQDNEGGLFGYRIKLDDARYFLALKLQRSRSYSFLGSERIPQSARVVLLEFVDNELDVLWSFRDFGWTRLG